MEGVGVAEEEDVVVEMEGVVEEEGAFNILWKISRFQYNIQSEAISLTSK